ncbi:hypothetical protein, partial [Enterococcus faecium]
MKNMNMPNDTASPKKEMDMNSMEAMKMSDMAGMDMKMEMPGEFNYNMLRALHPTTLDSSLKPREVKLTLTGNMLRYVWSFDFKT